MLVLDTSAVLDALLDRPGDPRLLERLQMEEEIAAPHLIDIELLHALRRLVRRGTISAAQAAETRFDFGDLRILRYPHAGMADRIWQLRHNLSAYDATYVALAELLGCPLVTTDGRLAKADGHRVEVEVYGSG